MLHSKRLNFLIGSPRSGTSWLGNILDSHPETVYRMEPDTILRGEYPFTSDVSYASAAREHINALANLRSLKVSGSRPVFKKSDHGILEHRAKVAYVYLFKALERLRVPMGRVSVPDFVDTAGKTTIIKSVSMLGRANSWHDACPGSRVVHIIRHPCGHVYSSIQGRLSGNLEDQIPLGFEACGIARKYGIDRRRLETMSEVDRLAWRWAILNEKATQDIPTSLVLTYEQLCADPIGETKRVLGFLDLAWLPQVEDFVISSTSSGDGAFFETRRDPMKAANRWREDFVDQDVVMSQIGHTKIARLFSENSTYRAA